MRIPDSFGDHKVSPQQGMHDPKQANRASGTQAPRPEDPSVHSPDPEVVELIAQVSQIPEIRESVVKEVAGRLANADYLTPEAAERTAEALLES